MATPNVDMEHNQREWIQQHHDPLPQAQVDITTFETIRLRGIVEQLMGEESPTSRTLEWELDNPRMDYL